MSFLFPFVRAAVAALVVMATVAVSPAAQKEQISSGFVPPAAPSPSAAPRKDLPQYGRDKHNMPFYHPKQRNRVVRTTAYTHSESDHVRYGVRSAYGTQLRYSDTMRSAAADWSIYPLGTQFRIKGQPYIYEVDDYGSALVGTGTIDIYHPSRALMRAWATRYVEIEVLRWGSAQKSMQMLSARTKARHCARMHDKLKAQIRLRETSKKS